MRRAFASSLLSLLLLTTLVWGGCISCEQFFMLPSVKSCCGGDGHCKAKQAQRPARSRDCKQIAYAQQGSVVMDVQLQVAAVRSPGVPPQAVAAGMAGAFTGWRRGHGIEPSPPDLQALHSTFLI